MKQSELVFGALTKVERSALLYLEECAVNSGGMVEQQRMNGDDSVAIQVLIGHELLKFGRIPAKLIMETGNRTHYVQLTDLGWAVASLCRQLRALSQTTYAHTVFDELRSLGIAV